VFNFAQGAMVFLAAATVVGFQAYGVPFVVAVLLAMAVMVIFAFATERFMLRKLVNQHEITLFMATIGLTFFVEGLTQLVWGTEVRKLELGIADEPVPWIMDNLGLLVSSFDIVAAVVAAGLIALLALFFAVTKVGRALRAVADDHEAAQSIGIPLNYVWGVVWSVSGFIALVAGLMWGARNGVQFSLVFVALKALPVLILGGFTSVPGVIVGGLVIGASEKLAEVYLGPLVGGGIEGWFPYVLALTILLVRPEGLFGEKIIRRI
jgi:branched-chain amino acid transport system permease protein